jgi:hypothetical protein
LKYVRGDIQDLVKKKKSFLFSKIWGYPNVFNSYKRSPNMDTQNKGTILIRSVLVGIGMTVLYLLIGTVLDYFITQGLSQFILTDCSEDCYFQYFNTIFAVVTLLSIVGGIRSGIQTYNRLSENDT